MQKILNFEYIMFVIKKILINEILIFNENESWILDLG
jgi:hypothetical protein